MIGHLDETPRIIAALQHVDSTDRETWIRCGMAVRGELGEDGFPIWDEWSRSAGNYVERDARDVWRSFGDSGPVGLGSLFRLAREAGWSDTTPRLELSPEEMENRCKYREEAKAKDHEESQRIQAQTIRWAGELLAGAPEATQHPYLTRKGLKPTSTLKTIHTDRIQKLTGWTPVGKASHLQGNLLAARCVRPGSGVAVTLELIDADGRKAGLPGRGTRTGAFWPTSLPLPKPGKASTILIGEGIATTLSGTQATGFFGCASLSSSNLVNVAIGLRAQYPGAKLIILADLVKATGEPDPHAVEAVRAVGGYLAVPDFGPGRKPDQKDVNDLLVLRGPEAVNACIKRAAPVDPEQAEQQAPSIWDSPADVGVMMATEPEPMAWLVKDRIPLGRGGALSALGGTGKTTFLKTLAFGCVTGRMPIDGWSLERRGRAVLVLTEDTPADVHDSLASMGCGLTTREREAIASDLIIYPLAGQEMKLLAKSARGVVERSPLFHSLAAKINTIGGVVLVGLDPALALTEGDEQDQGNQRALGKMVDDLAVMTGATCVLLTHSGKALLGADELNSHSSRGGGALTDAVRFELTMRGMTAKEATRHGITDLEERKGLVQIVVTKGNRVPPAAKVPTWLRFEQGVLVSAKIQEAVGERATSAKLSKSARLAFEALRQASMESGLVVDGEFHGTPTAEWRCVHQILYTESNPENGERARRKAFNDGVSKLVELGMVVAKGEGYTFAGPGAETHVEIILAAIKERARRNCGTEQNFSEQSAAIGTQKAERNGTLPFNRASSGSAGSGSAGDDDQVVEELL